MITLTTDFGDSAYAGAVRGVLLARAPGARVVDVTHAVPPGDVTAGALALLATLPHFPRATPSEPVVHVAVVDPGVGTSRRGLVLACDGCFLVGPDNGLLVPAARKLGLREARSLREPKLWNEPVSPVFHARDVFAPVAAHLHSGGAAADVGPKVEEASLVAVDLGGARTEKGAVSGRVLAVDGFGNATTNIPESAVRRLRAAEVVSLDAKGMHVKLPFCRTYGEVVSGRPLVLVGSSGFVEIAVSRGSAAERFGLAPGDEVRLSP